MKVINFKLKNQSLHYTVALCLFFLAVNWGDLNAQSANNIANVAYRFEGTKLLISYDIIKSGTVDTWEISLVITTASGEKIYPKSVYGDVKRGVVPGRKRTIIWDTNADDVVLDENFTLEVLAIPEKRKDIVPDSIARKYEFHHYTDIGLGFGIDYGGVFGGKFTFSPVKYLGVFVAGGAQFGGFGWQAGAKGYAIPRTSKKGFRPNLKVMYGINAVIYVMDYDKYNKLYPGLSLGPGMEFRFGRMKKHGLNVDLNFPFRSQEFYDDWEKVKNDPLIEIQSDPLPFSLSFGYHLEF